jgi:signal transduction histidine kinase
MPRPPALNRISTLLRTPTADLGDAPAAEIAVQVPSGEKLARRILQVRVFPIHDSNGARLGLGLLLRDVTQEKELDQMKSQLLSTVSHELRTPLASIKGFATTLLRRDVDWDETTKREFLAIIDEESDRLSELISNLLDMSRIEAGTLRVEPEAMDLQPLIQETVDEYQVLTHEHLFEAQLPQPLPKVWGDPRRIRQVLRNLVENAVKYSPGGGRITISTKKCRGSDSIPEKEVQVSVSDQGLGIESEHLEHLFDRFYQVDSTASPQVGGLGLGLSICKAIIEAHKGRIWAESQLGVGSVFHFTLLTEEENSVD